MRKLLQLAIVLALILAAGRGHADVRLPRIFTDHMVLQQELPIAVWGWADAGEKVTISLGGKTVTAEIGRAHV